MKSTILVVDDEPSLTDQLAQLLETEGYNVLVANTADDGYRLALSAEPDLALLDIMMPGTGGFELCKHIRRHSSMPIIFITALDDVDSVVQGLGVGADDYLVKPWENLELVARINAHIRRIQRVQSSTPSLLTFSNGDLVIDLPARRVTVYDKEVDLTPREFDLFAALARNAGRVIPTKELIQTAWGAKYRDATDNIKPYIHYLRKKIETDPASPHWIVTARGVGYRFVDH